MVEPRDASVRRRSAPRDRFERGPDDVLDDWGYEHGDWEGDDYARMQVRLRQGYETLAATLSSEVAPVGVAWASAVGSRPGLDLWKRDGHHPSRAGSYLAACVFYRQLTGRDPLNSSYLGGLDTEDARFLQLTAGDVVDEYEATR